MGWRLQFGNVRQLDVPQKLRLQLKLFQFCYKHCVWQATLDDFQVGTAIYLEWHPLPGSILESLEYRFPYGKDPTGSYSNTHPDQQLTPGLKGIVVMRSLFILENDFWAVDVELIALLKNNAHISGSV
jgi:hypothetical protein